jgi:hypothetical protein
MNNNRNGMTWGMAVLISAMICTGNLGITLALERIAIALEKIVEIRK